jgi:hypothetical protein
VPAANFSIMNLIDLHNLLQVLADYYLGLTSRDVNMVNFPTAVGQEVVQCGLRFLS